MSHVTQDTSWCTIDIDTTTGTVMVLERWQYVWLLHSTLMSAWTAADKREFHARAEREIWSAWSNRAHLRVEGSSDFAGRFSGRELPVRMDIRWVLAKPHWTVLVTKVPQFSFSRSHVRWTSRQITLDTNDFASRQVCFGPPKNVCVAQIPVAHEFGHTMGNIGKVHGEASDEYDDGTTKGRKRSPHLADVHSMLHRGSQLRKRHFDHLMTELHDLIPNTVFSISSLR